MSLRPYSIKLYFRTVQLPINGGVGEQKGHFAWEEFVSHAQSTVAKGDFYLLGVQIRLLTQ